MKFVLNTKKGTMIKHPALGELKGGVAYEFTDEEAMQVKNIINILVFDEVIMK